MYKKILLTILIISVVQIPAFTCSVLYYVDDASGKIYAANSEDYWYDVKPYIQINPKSKGKFARLWYGWDNFAQGGINEAGLFFDGAASPDQTIPKGYHKPKGNLGDEILAKCSTVNEAVDFLAKEKIALSNGHMMFGDRLGNAVVLEWVDGERKITPISENRLVMTNFLLSDPTKGNYPCPRYNAIEEYLKELQLKEDAVSLLQVGNALGRAVQLPTEIEAGRIGGTLYSSFINISDMELFLVYKLDNARVTKLDLNAEFAGTKKRKIALE